MNAELKTIPCTGSFGDDIQKTKDQFIDAWAITLTGLIDSDFKNYGAIKTIEFDIKHYAERRWIELYNAQNPDQKPIRYIPLSSR